MPLYPTDMTKARAAADQRDADRRARRNELAAQHARTIAEAERQAREFAEAFDVPPESVFGFICTRGH